MTDLTAAGQEDLDLLRRSVRDLFASKFGADYVRACDEQKRPPTEAFGELARLGYLGLSTGEAYGGGAGGAAAVAALLEELGHGFLDLAFWVFRNLAHGSRAISAHGTQQQRQRYLPDLAQGKISVCFALTEPDAGSDAASVRTAATRAEGGYLVTGQKVFCSGFRVSDYVLTVTRTGHGPRRHHGITLLLIPTSAPGLSASPLQTLGHWPLGTSLLHFDGVFVPEENRLGPEGDGWQALMSVLEFERLCLSAARTGAAQAALDEALAYAKSRHQFGQPIGSFQAVSHKLADMQMMVEISRMLVYRFASQLDAGRSTARDAAILKLYVSETYKQVADAGLQILGGYGYTMDFSLQRHFRESRLGTIGAGTSEVQRNIIAKTMGLG
jgi:alkylation response protein AidB-like acyl-CoA dehydrogenase